MRKIIAILCFVFVNVENLIAEDLTNKNNIPELLKFENREPQDFSSVTDENVILMFHADGRVEHMGKLIGDDKEILPLLKKFLDGVCNCKDSK